MLSIKNIEPKLLWDYFTEISKIPRCSKHEEKIRQYLLDFAKTENLKSKKDKAGNIVIFKPASAGMENKPTVILQSHMDMVCEKNSGIDHDFAKDPITFKLEGNMLKANGTTLGADDGIGIATSMAILKDEGLKHGPIEALFTVDEETGLTGAFALESDMLTARILLNIDSEDFGVVTVGCAGGGDSKIKLDIKTANVNNNFESILLKVSGLRGGHSGVDANEQRGNAIKIIARIIWKLSQKYDILISDIKGGDKHNAIPRESYAKISIKSNETNDFIKNLEKEYKNILTEIKPIDPDLKIETEKINKLNTCIDQESKEKLINLLHGLPHGVDKWSYEIPDLVETSTNLATIVMENNTATIGLSSRSSIDSALQNFRDRINAIASLSGAKVEEGNAYPGWKPNLDSKLLKLSKETFMNIYGKEPVVEAIHAGLECGIIGEKFPGMDMISIGPTIKYPHSPDEQVDVTTVDKFYYFVLKILESL
jgi:dipeptidase D